MAANIRKPQPKLAETVGQVPGRTLQEAFSQQSSRRYHLLCVNVIPTLVAKWLQQFQPSHLGTAGSRGTRATFSSWSTLERGSLPLTGFSLSDWSELGRMLIYKQVTGQWGVGGRWSYCD